MHIQLNHINLSIELLIFFILLGMKNMSEKYDVIIIGGGPAGLTAGIYASRYGLKTMILYEAIGGYMAVAHKVCNYPGFNEISGYELTKKMQKQAQDLGVKMEMKSVKKIDKEVERSHKDLEKKNVEHERFNRIAVGREMRMIELKERIAELERKEKA